MAKFSEYKSLDLIDVAENVAAYWKNNDHGFVCVLIGEWRLL